MQLQEDGIFFYRPNLDFCVWVLEQDGLKVSPFDKHGDGDGQLRQAGLNEDAWRAWFSAVALNERLAVAFLQRVKRLERSTSERARALMEKSRDRPMGTGAALVTTVKFLWSMVPGARAIDPPPPRLKAPDAWQGPPEVLLMLRALWKKYNRVGGRRTRRPARFDSAALKEFADSPEYSKWKDELVAQYGDSDNMPAVLLVVYPGPTISTVDSVLVLGAQQWIASPAAVLETLEAAFTTMKSLSPGKSHGE